MKSGKVILLIVAGVLIIPIFSLAILSFANTGANTFAWYGDILKNQKFVNSFVNSFYIGLLVAAITLILSSYISLSYYDVKKKLITILFIAILGLMPADILSISINKMAQLMGFYKSNLSFLIIGLVLYCLPFSLIILWTRYYFIDKSIIRTSEDLGLKNYSIIFKIIFPLSKSALVSVFLFSFLLTFNEYTRTYYLSGSTEYLSEYLNGKLSSGTDNSIYAGATISIAITCFIIFLFILYNKAKSIKQQSV